jgi:hypothetical protein
MLAPAILFPSARTANLLFDSNKTSPRASSSNKGANGVTTAAPQSLARTLTDSSSLDELATVCQTLPGTLAAALVLEMHVRAERSHENDSHRSNAQSSSSAVDGNSGAFGVGAGPLLDLLASSAAAAAAAVLASLPADELPQIFESMSIESRAAATRFLPNQDGSRQPTSATAAAAGGGESATKTVIPPELPHCFSEEMGSKMSNAAAGRIVSAVQGSAPDDSNSSSSSSSSASTATTKTPKLPPRRPRKLPPPPSVDLVEVCLLFEGEVKSQLNKLIMVLSAPSSVAKGFHPNYRGSLENPSMQHFSTRTRSHDLLFLSIKYCACFISNLCIRSTMRATPALTLSPGSLPV